MISQLSGMQVLGLSLAQEKLHIFIMQVFQNEFVQMKSTMMKIAVCLSVLQCHLQMSQIDETEN